MGQNGPPRHFVASPLNLAKRTSPRTCRHVRVVPCVTSIAGPNGMRNCARDEGGPFEFGNQVLIRFATLAETQGISIFTYSRAHVRECFQYLGAPTKQHIAEIIAKHIPAFVRFLPPPRKRWRSEDFRMGLFDAAALGLTFLQASE
jgi:hypothetical protein